MACAQRDAPVNSMHLFNLGELPRAKCGQSVPDWALGCFRRRSITYYGGQVDETTEVLWLQSGGLTADFRLSPGVRTAQAAARAKWRLLPPPLAPAEALTQLPLHELVALAAVEGGISRAQWDGEHLHWSDWISFQTHAKWPEPGRLRRVGNCLIEFAPSGAYVEDWRLQSAGKGPLIGLSLVEERELDSGDVRHRGGGLIVCGEHAAFVRGRAAGPSFDDGSAERVDELVRRRGGEPATLQRVFALDASYARADAAGAFVVTLSTLPWRLEQPLIELEGFAYDAARDLLVQHVEERGIAIERRFTIDSLEPSFVFTESTAPSAEAENWFERERHGLLAE
jgi:hypothetical protein